MRRFTLVICLLSVAVACAQSAEPELVPPDPDALGAFLAEKVSLELKDVPLKEAIEQLFKAGDQNQTYVLYLDPALDQAPYDKITVSMNLKNVRFHDAIGDLCSTHQLTMLLAGNVTGNVISIRPQSPRVPPHQTAGALPDVGAAPGTDADQPDLATMSVPSMPVEQALRVLYREDSRESPWGFKDGLGSITMPGARFYRFPREMAAAVMLVAAGLVPPPGDRKYVASKGKVDLSTRIQWTPKRHIPPGFRPASLRGYGGYLPPRGGAGRGSGFDPTESRYDPAVAIAAYKWGPAGNEWLLTILASQEADTEVLEKLLATSGSRYVMGELTSRPFTTMMTTADKEGNRQKQETTIVLPGPQIISAQLYDVTLDEALDALLPPIKLIYRKRGPRENPTYVIDVQPIDPDAPVVPTRKPPAGKEKDENADK